jgi:hypothetical protein
LSTTKAELRTMVRSMLRDTALPYHVQDAELDFELGAALVLTAGKVTLGEKWDNASVAVTAGSDTATLPTTYEYAVISAVRRTADGHEVEKVTQREMEGRYWQGTNEAEKAHADPTHYALSEDLGIVSLRFQAPVLTTGTLDVRRSVLPLDLTTPTAVVPLSAFLTQAVADFAASVLAAKLPQNELDLLRLDRGVAQTFLVRGTTLVRDELIRLNRMASTGPKRG